MSASQSFRSMSSLWMSTAEASLAMWTTLSFRIPMLLAGTMTDIERNKMVGEKVEAATESLWGAAFAMGQAMTRGPAALYDAGSAFDSAVGFMTAASKPYHRRVTANARRLSR